MTTRDKHSPANIDPAAYDYQGQIYQGPLEDIFPMGALMGGADVVALRAIMDEITNRPLQEKVRKAARDGGYSGAWVNSQQCDHCGHAHFHYGDVYRHGETGQYVVLGWMCSEDVFSFDTRRQIDNRNAEQKVAGIRKRGKAKVAAMAFLAKNDGLEAALTLGDADGESSELRTLADMRSRLLKWGGLSEKQVAYALKMAVDVSTGDTYEVRKARKIAERDAAMADVAAWTEGRTRIEGVVVSVREPDEYASYPSWKWLVQVADGKRVWGSIPTGIVDSIMDERVEIPTPSDVLEMADAAGLKAPICHRDAEVRDLKGRTVVFAAAIQPKDGDLHFAFYKRPTKAELLPQEVTA